MIDPFCHSASVAVARPAEAVFPLLADGLLQGRWAWGSAGRTDLGGGVFRGVSVFDGRETFVRLLPDAERLLVDYEVGRARERMQFRNMARVIAGPVLGLGPEQSVVTLLTWRIAAQTDADWAQIGTVHEAEMFLIRGLAERAEGGDGPC